MQTEIGQTEIKISINNGRKSSDHAEIKVTSRHKILLWINSGKCQWHGEKLIDFPLSMPDLDSFRDPQPLNYIWQLGPNR